MAELDAKLAELQTQVDSQTKAWRAGLQDAVEVGKSALENIGEDQERAKKGGRNAYRSNNEAHLRRLSEVGSPSSLLDLEIKAKRDGIPNLRTLP